MAIVNVVPSFGLLFTCIAPLWISIVALAIANPSPAPNILSVFVPR